MADSKISALPDVTALSLSDQFAVVQSGTSKRASIQDIKDLIPAGQDGADGQDGLDGVTFGAPLGGYDASTNTPNLQPTDTHTAGDYYTVQVEGTNSDVTGSSFDFKFGMRIRSVGTGYVIEPIGSDVKTESRRTGINWYNYENDKLDYYVGGGAGAESALSGARASEFIAIPAGVTTVVISGRDNSVNGLKTAFFYNSSKVFISDNFSDGGTPIAVPSGAAYVRFNSSFGGTDKHTTTQIQEGSTATGYEPYTVVNYITEVAGKEIHANPDDLARYDALEDEVILINDNPNFGVYSDSEFFNGLVVSSNIRGTTVPYFKSLGIKQEVRQEGNNSLFYFRDYGTSIVGKYVQMSFLAKMPTTLGTDFTKTLVSEANRSNRELVTPIETSVVQVTTGVYRITKTIFVPNGYTHTTVWVGAGFASGFELVWGGFYTTVSDNMIPMGTIDLTPEHLINRVNKSSLMDDRTDSFWNGKNILYIGHSIPATNGVPKYLQDRTGAYVNDQTISGSILSKDAPTNNLVTTIAEYATLGASGFDNRSWEKRISPYIANTDLIIFELGISDGQANKDTPPVTHGDRTNFIGAYQYMIEKCFELKPTIRIALIGHHSRKDTNAEKTATAMQYVADEYSLPLLRLDKILGWTNTVVAGTGGQTVLQQYCSDLLHPSTALSYSIYGTSVLNFINSIG